MMAESPFNVYVALLPFLNAVLELNPFQPVARSLASITPAGSSKYSASRNILLGGLDRRSH
jgi:hypothetical protein